MCGPSEYELNYVRTTGAIPNIPWSKRGPIDPIFSTAYGSATGAPLEVVYTAPSLVLNTCWEGMLVSGVSK